MVMPGASFLLFFQEANLLQLVDTVQETRDVSFVLTHQPVCLNAPS
jgi:predicted TIM-barrel fold metal-dependent hydrolase